jgi:uncharacterized protein (DUF433 family)
MAAGAGVDEVLADRRYLEGEDVLATLEYVATDAQEPELRVATSAWSYCSTRTSRPR